MKVNNIQYFFWIHILFASAAKNNNSNNCEQCVHFEDCPSFAHLSRHKQQLWLEQVPCKPTPSELSMKSISENNYICCPNSNTWINEKDEENNIPDSQTSKSSVHKRSPRQYDNLRSTNNGAFSWRNQCASASLLPSPESRCCGISNFLLGDTVIGDGIDIFPWSALLSSTFQSGKKKSFFTCKGSLISAQYILTAAHCVNQPKSTLETVVVQIAKYGDGCGIKTMPRYPYGIVPDCIANVLVEDVIVHEHYQSKNFIHDIALIKLKDTKFTQHIPPICVPNFDIDDYDLADEELIVAGWDRAANIPYALDWGVDEESLIKLAPIVHHVPYDKCLKTFYPQLTMSHICAASRTGYITQEGDSGSPLMLLIKPNYYVVGVVSAVGEAQRGNGWASLYTNVYRHFSWIKKNIIN